MTAESDNKNSFKGLKALIHTFGLDYTAPDPEIYGLYRAAAIELVGSDAVKAALHAAILNGDGTSAVTQSERQFFIDRGIWPDDLVILSYLRGYEDTDKLHEAAHLYVTQDGGPG